MDNLLLVIEEPQEIFLCIVGNPQEIYLQNSAMAQNLAGYLSLRPQPETVLTGPESCSLSDSVQILIGNYDPAAVYELHATIGVAQREGGVITWTMPDVFPDDGAHNTDMQALIVVTRRPGYFDDQAGHLISLTST